MKCQIRWIDSFGNLTPDTNEAIGYATCHYMPIKWADGTTSGEDHWSTPSPICAEHYKRLITMSNWDFIPLTDVDIISHHC